MNFDITKLLKIGIMQPYFLPYIGYWQLINYVDVFVIYDNIKYTKKGWINRNRYLLNNAPHYFTLPLKKDSDYKNVIDRSLSGDFNREELRKKIYNSYNKCVFFDELKENLDCIFLFEENNLFKYIYNSIVCMNKILNINTKIIVSSELDIDHSLKAQDKVLAINKALNGNIYINPIGGVELYNKISFLEENIELKFIKNREIEYQQFNKPFISNLSIIDVIAFNGIQKTQKILENFTLI